eukprot:gene229-246_t
MLLCLLFALFSNYVCATVDFNVATTSFNLSEANISLWLSAAAYCGKDNYASHVFKGPTSGFVYTATISDLLGGTQGYVGYLPSDKSIYVVYRGSQSVRNWITNLDAWKTSYTSYPECNCEVHKGFYLAEQSVISQVVHHVQQLKTNFPSYSIKLTGHSLGGALAQLTAMDLFKASLIPASVYTFGQPRTGDKEYSHFSSPKFPTWRLTHHKDMVPHLPVMDYAHVCKEEYEDGNGHLHDCNGCESTKCAAQFWVSDTNVEDHLTYLGLGVNCESVSM